MLNVSFNVSHDSSYVAMAFQIGPDPNLRSPDIGIDIMKAELPRGETIRSFVSVISDQVALPHFIDCVRLSEAALLTSFDDIAADRSGTTQPGLALSRPPGSNRASLQILDH